MWNGTRGGTRGCTWGLRGTRWGPRGVYVDHMGGPRGGYVVPHRSPTLGRGVYMGLSWTTWRVHVGLHGVYVERVGFHVGPRGILGSPGGVYMMKMYHLGSTWV